MLVFQRLLHNIWIWMTCHLLWNSNKCCVKGFSVIPSTTAMNLPFKSSLYAASSAITSVIDEYYKLGQRAAKDWGMYATPFLNEEDGTLLEERLVNGGDVGYVRIGGFPSCTRHRYVMTNIDLELDLKSVESEYCTLLIIDNIDTASMPGQHPWPHLLNQIGIDVENVGDIVVENNYAYMALNPNISKQCCRLLPKEMRGVGITVRVIEEDDPLPIDGIKVNMQLGKLDKRAMKYKQ